MRLFEVVRAKYSENLPAAIVERWCKMAKLKAFEITNFMGYNEGRIEFDDRNIINIKGYNSSGKSAMLRALNVFFTFAWKTSLTNFIKHDKDYFELAGEFDDGTLITMRKKRGGAVSYRMVDTSEGTLVYTTEDEDNKALWNSQAVPHIIAKYFNVLTDTSNLHYRKGRDPLLLVDTTPGQNYKLLSEVLQSTLALKALQLAKKDLKDAQKEFQDVEAVREHTMERVYEVEHLTHAVVAKMEALQKQLQTQMDIAHKLSEYRDVLIKLETREKVACLKTLEMPDLSQLTRLTEISDLHRRQRVLTPIASLETLEKPDATKLELLKDVSELHTRQQALAKIAGLNLLEVPNTARYALLSELEVLYKKKEANRVPVDIEVSKKLSEAQASIQALHQQQELLLNIVRVHHGILAQDTVQRKQQQEKYMLVEEIKAYEHEGLHLVRCDHCNELTTATGVCVDE